MDLRAAGDGGLRADWPGLLGVDEVSRFARVRASDLDASEKVWLRQWYEPQHLDKDLNADGRLTDADNNGMPDAPANPSASVVDEWYPRSWPSSPTCSSRRSAAAGRRPGQLGVPVCAAPACGAVGGTQMVFPVGVMAASCLPERPRWATA